MFFFKKKGIISPTGVFAVSAKKLIPLNELPNNGSIIDIRDSLGYSTHHIVHISKSKKISFIAFKRYTKEPMFIEVNDKTQSFTYSDIANAMKEIDWDFQNRQLGFEDSLSI